MCGRAGRLYGISDSPRIVLDEVCGMLVAGAFLPTSAWTIGLVFVPFAALFEHARFAHAFAASVRGFALNMGPLLLFGLLSLALTFLGLLTFWIGLVAVLPLLATASYAAWKDIYQPQALSLKPC